MIVDVVTDVLKQRWGSPSEISPNVWLSIEERSLSGQCENDRAVWVSRCRLLIASRNIKKRILVLILLRDGS